MTPRALKTLRPRWLRLPDREAFSRPLPWLILLALITVLIGVTIIARIALDLASPDVARYAGDLTARGRADYSFWPGGPLIPPINPEAIAAAESDQPSAAPPDGPQSPDSVPIVVVAAATPMPSATSVPPSPSPTATQTAAPTDLPPTVVPSATQTIAARQAPTTIPAQGNPPTATAQIQPSATPVTEPGSPPVATPRPTNTPAPPTSTPQATSTPQPTSTPAPTNTPAPSNTPAPPTNTPTPTSTPEPPPPELSFATTALVASEEQGQATVEVRLNLPATRTVTVAYSTGGGTATPNADYRPASGTLSFSPGVVTRSFTIEILRDNLNEPNETVEIRLSAPTNAVIVGPSVAILTITDSDVPPIARFAGERRTLPESAGSAAVSIELSQPGAIDVSIPYAVSGTAGTTDHTLRPGAVIIPAGATGARLRFAIIDDLIDEDDEQIVVTLGTPINASLGSPSVYVFTIVDDDTAGVTLSQARFDLAEGQSASYTLTLESEPISPVTVSLRPDQQLRASPAALVFTPENWNRAQTVTVTAFDDDVDEASPHEGRLIHEVSSVDANYNNLAVSDIVVAITDNDTAGVRVMSDTPPLRLQEGANLSYRVVLESEPTAPVTITLVPDIQVTVTPRTLVFTPASWRTPQTVLLSAIDDAVAEGDEHPGQVIHQVTSVDSNYEGIAVAPVNVTIIDNDRSGVIIDRSSLSLTEAPGPTQAEAYSVRLSSQPTAPVEVALSFDREVTLNGQTTSPLMLSFTPLNWSAAQTVTVRAVDDAIDEDGDRPPLAPNTTPHLSVIRHITSSADPFYNRNAPELRPFITVSIIDNDTAQLIVTPTSLTVTEGLTGEYSVRLATQPRAPVTVRLEEQSDGLINLSPATLTFTALNWSAPQTVTVRAADDDVDTTYPPERITHILVSDDPAYNGLPASSVEVRVIDDDTAEITISSSALTLTEGLTATYTVRLATQPTQPVTVSLTINGPVTITPPSLVFDPANWAVSQMVTVESVDDDVDAPDAMATVTHTAISNDPGYAAAMARLLTVTVPNDDEAGLAVSLPSDWRTSESGGSITFTVRLQSRPLTPVTVSVTTSNPAEAVVSDPPMPLVFDGTNWNTPMTVTVTGVDDADLDGPVAYSVYVTIDPGSGYAQLNSLTELRFTNLNDDRVQVSFTTAETVIREDVGEARLTVQLAQSLTYTVTAGYESFPGTATADEDYTPVGGTLIFAPGEVTKTVSVPILNNDVTAEERYETLYLLLLPGDGTELASPAVVTVLIEEDGVASPPESPLFLSTAGPLRTLQQSYWYTNADEGGGGGSNFVQIAVPCSWPPAQPLVVELWSPAIHYGAGAGSDLVDPQTSDGPNETRFELYDGGSVVAADAVTITPGGIGLLATQTYAASTAAETWSPLAVITTPVACGSYLLHAWTDGDDENYWAVRAGYDHDGLPNTAPVTGLPNGERVSVGTLLSSVELRSAADTQACLTAWVNLAPGTATLRLRNFDLDLEAGEPEEIGLRYYAPDQIYDPRGATGGIGATISSNGAWQEDSFAAPAAGWWRVAICSGGQNRFALEATGDGVVLPLFYDAPYRHVGG